MLNNVFFLPIVTLSIKNNFFVVNLICYKIPSWLLINLNNYNIYFFEKILIDFNLKQFYFLFFQNIFYFLLFVQFILLLIFF